MARNPLRYDPTRTATLQRQFATALRKKFLRVRKHMMNLLLREDAFGLKKQAFSFNVFCPTGVGGGVDPTCSPHAAKRQTVLKQLEQSLLGRLTEKGHIVSQGGEVLATMDQVSDVTEVLFTAEQEKLAEHQVFTHNHPAGTNLSDGDFMMAVSMNVSQYRAVMERDGVASVAILTRPETGWPKIDVGPDSRLFTEAFLVAKDETTKLPWKSNREARRYLSDIKVSIIAKAIGAEFSIEELETPTANTRWQFSTTSEQLDSFQEWLARELQDEILNDPTMPIDDWWDQYLQRGFRQGAGRAFDDTKPAALGTLPGTIPRESMSDFYNGTRDEFLRSSFAHPETVEKLKLLSGRVLGELKGVTEAVAQGMGRSLADGLSRGSNPRVIARQMAKDVDGIGLRRALTITRTEIIRAHAEGQLDAFGRLGVEELGVMVEWSTSHDNRVCKLCAPLEKTVIKLSEAKGMLPRHPNCRCAWIPANVGEDTKPQNRTKKQVEGAFDKSITAEIPEGSTRTLKEQRAKTKWIGADAVVAKKRPVSVLDLVEEE